MFVRRSSHLESKIILTAINDFNHTRLQLRFEIYALSSTPGKVVELARLFCVMLWQRIFESASRAQKEARGLRRLSSHSRLIIYSQLVIHSPA